MHRKITVKALTLVFFLFSIVSFASDNDKTKEETVTSVVLDTEKNLRLLADAWRMSQETDKAIPILEEAASMSKDGKN